MIKIARNFITPILASALLAVTGVAPAAQELRLSTFVPPGHVIYREILMPWAEAVAKATNGEVKVTLYPAMQLGGKAPELYRQAAEGVVDIVFTLPGYTSAAFPRTQIIELPGMKPNGIAATNMMWDLLDPYLLPDFKGTKVIALWGNEDGGVMTRGKPIRTLEEFKGARIRAPSAIQARQLELLGAAPIAMPAPEVYLGLERGVLDGALMPFSTIIDFRLGEVAKSYTLPGPVFGRSAFLIAMNSKKYDSLSPAARAAIDKLSGRELSLRATDVYIKRSTQGVDGVRGKAEVVELSAEEQRRLGAALRPAIAEWIKESEAKGIPAREMLKRAGHPG